MHNANARKNTYTFGETSPIENQAIAERVGKKAETIRKAIIKLVKADLIERHPVKRQVYIIPSMIRARAEIAEQATVKRHINITKSAEKRIEELERDMECRLTENEKKRVYADTTLAYGQKHRNGSGSHRNGNGHPPTEVPYPF